jgi:hypothetical protein
VAIPLSGALNVHLSSLRKLSQLERIMDAAKILRGYQEKLVFNVCRTTGDILVEQPTGARKTVQIVAIVAMLLDKRFTHAVIAAPQEQIEQGFVKCDYSFSRAAPGSPPRFRWIVACWETIDNDRIPLSWVHRTGEFMAATPVQEPPRVPPVDSVEQQFCRLEAEWQTDTRYLSNPGKIMSHPAMRAIVERGEEVLPIILRDLQAKPSLLVWALPEITGESLAPPNLEGGFLKWNVSAQIDAWMQWGREKGLI